MKDEKRGSKRIKDQPPCLVEEVVEGETDPVGKTHINHNHHQAYNLQTYEKLQIWGIPVGEGNSLADIW